MGTQTIDQAPSERALHRVLYIVKFLRAMVLHVMLAVAAALLYLFAGIDGLYPILDNLILALRAQALHNQAQDGPLGSVGFWIAVAIVVVVLLIALIWIYRSITKVRPTALKVQALLIVLAALWNVHGFWPALQFAFANLDSLFAVAAAVSIALSLFVFPVSVAFGLWLVARVPERSSLVATLDPRLAPNAWAYWNKLLDLPRTPLRTWSTAAAYALALAGALLLIAAIMHLLTLGGTSNRLSVLALACDREVLPKCVASSADWAGTLPFSIVLAFAGVKLAGLLQSTAKRIGGLSVAEVLRKPNDPFLLYLRPFDTDDITLPKPQLPLLSRLFSFHPFPVRIEEELFDVADGYRPLIAVGKPGTSADVHGGVAYRTFLDNAVWQGYVADKIERAQHIVLVMKNTAGVRWEIARVVAQRAASRTLFLFDPALQHSAEWETLEEVVVPLLQEAGIAPAGFTFAARPIGFYFRDHDVVEIINANRSATSYRTAFSHFLAEPAVPATS